MAILRGDHGPPRFLAGPPVFCLISRSSSLDWPKQQITFGQQYFTFMGPPTFFLGPAVAPHFFHSRIATVTQKLRQNTNHLQLGGVILAVRGHDNFCSTVQYLQFKILEEYGAIATLGYAPTNSDWWPYGFVLILLLQVQTGGQLTPATKRQIWYG